MSSDDESSYSEPDDDRGCDIWIQEEENIPGTRGRGFVPFRYVRRWHSDACCTDTTKPEPESDRDSDGNISNDEDWFSPSIQRRARMEARGQASRIEPSFVDVTAFKALSIFDDIVQVFRDRQLHVKLDVTWSDISHFFATITVQTMVNNEVQCRNLGAVRVKENYSPGHVKRKLVSRLKLFHIQWSQIVSVSLDLETTLLRTPQIVKDEENIPEGEGEILQEWEEDRDFEEKCDKDEKYKKIVPILNGVSVDKKIPSPAMLITEAVMAALKPFEGKVSDVSSAARYAKLERARKTLNCPAVPELDHEQRWSFIYYLAHRLIRLEPKKIDYGLSHISDDKWDYAREINVALKPVEQLMRNLLDKKYLFGDFFVALLSCLATIIRIRDTGNELARELVKELNRQKKVLLSTPILVAALYLDPRVRTLSTQQETMALEYLYKLQSELESAKEMFRPGPSKRTKPETNGKSTLKQQLRRLRQIGSHNLKYKDNMFDYWAELCADNPNLKDLVEVVLSVPITQKFLDTAHDAIFFLASKVNIECNKHQFLTAMNLQM